MQPVSACPPWDALRTIWISTEQLWECWDKCAVVSSCLGQTWWSASLQWILCGLQSYVCRITGTDGWEGRALAYPCVMYTRMKIGFCIDGHLLCHKKKMYAMRNLYIKTIMIIYSLRCRALWNQWKNWMELRERGNRKENDKPSVKLHTVMCR
jgi:hypothetical protein